MFSKLSSLMSNNLFFASRQKVLLKRRKMTSKKQKVAKKKFLEQNPKGSYTNELRILQIQKELDKKVNKNQHLNELMDELFYPDVRYSNQRIMEQNLLNLSNNPQENIASKNKPHILRQQGEDVEQSEEFDELVQQIYLCQIPSQLFELYSKNSESFTQHHLNLYLGKLAYYFKNKSIIQDRVTYKWKQSLDKLKITDAEKKKKRRCPYIFIEQEQLIRDEQWNKVVKEINKKISITIEQIANQMNEQNQSDQKEQTVVDQSFYSLENNCDLVLQIKSAADYIPQELFNSIVKKMFVILNLNQNTEQKSEQKLPIFSHQEKVKLLQVLSLKGIAKSTLTKTLHIQSPQESEKQEEKIVAIGKKICQDILKSSQCSSEDLGAVIKSGKGHFRFLNSMLLELSKTKILKFLTSTDLQRSIDYMTVFWQNGTTKDVGFIQVLVFDIYRKLPFSSSKNHLLYMFQMIKDCRIFFRESEINVCVSSIYPRLVETVAKYINKSELSHEELKNFVNSIYENYPLYKVEHKLNVLQMVTTAIVKMGEGFKLEQITQLLFRTTVMGHRSKIFSKYVFERYQKEYRKLMKQYKESKIQLITDKSSKNAILDQDTDNLPSMNEVLLEENLIMMLWSFVASFSSQNASLPLSQMIEIYPLHIKSQDPMIQNLIEDLNVHLKEFNFFPMIKNKDLIEVKSKDNRRKSLKAISLLLKTNTFESYRYQYNDLIALELLEKLQEGKEPITKANFEDLVMFLMRYCLKIGKVDLKNERLPDRWDDGVKGIFMHRRDSYEKVKHDFLGQASSEQSQGETSLITFAKRITNLVEKKEQQQISVLNDSLPSGSGGKRFKLYQLL